jgi:hypothetical protein
MPSDNPYTDFWNTLKSHISVDALSAERQTTSSLVNMISAEIDGDPVAIRRLLERWRKRDLPPQSIADLIAILEVMGHKLVMVSSKEVNYYHTMQQELISWKERALAAEELSKS